jgi:2,3-bisphosphoglycerate-dependent phosphoglycerate mutase
MKSILTALILLGTVEISAGQTIFIVRHAERADAGTGGATMMATDPELSEAGRTRAEALASVLEDAGITAIFVTEYKRTQQTAAPLAKRLGITTQTVPSKDAEDLVAKVRAAKGNVLIVGHSNTVPATIKRLGIETQVTIGESDYDDLFIAPPGPPAVLLRLHYR